MIPQPFFAQPATRALADFVITGHGTYIFYQTPPDALQANMQHEFVPTRPVGGCCNRSLRPPPEGGPPLRYCVNLLFVLQHWLGRGQIPGEALDEAGLLLLDDLGGSIFRQQTGFGRNQTPHEPWSGS